VTHVTDAVDRPRSAVRLRLSAARGASLASLFDGVVLALALAGFVAFVLPHGYSVSESQMRLAVVALVPALLRLRPWRTLPRSALAVVGLCIAGAALILSRTMWDGAANAYFVIYGLLAYLLVAGYATTPRRRVGVVLVTFALALTEFAAGWHQWLAGGDPSGIMVGSIHWRNQFAVFLLGAGILAAAVFVRRTHPRLQVVSALTVAAAGAGIVLSTSRAALGLFVIGWLAVGLLALRGPRRGQAVVRWLSLPLLVIAVIVVMTQPMFFHGRHYSWPLIGHGERGTASLGRNNGYRLEYMRAGLQLWTHNPLFGTGFASFSRRAIAYLPAGTPPIFGCYNAWLDAFASGGIVYGFPMLALGTALAVMLATGVKRTWGGRSGDGVLGLGAMIAAGAMLAHVAYDADTYYPQVILMVAILAGLAHAASRSAAGVETASAGGPQQL
jgi:hypothetical protein